MKVYAVNVFESGDGTTEIWGVYDSLEKAENKKEQLLNSKELNSGGYYLVVNIEVHEVQ